MKTRWQVIILSLVFFIVGIILILGGYVWFQNKMARVDAGTARSTFPYSDYSLAELNKLYPQYIENNAPTTQTPEQTHQKFVDALKKGDIDEAVKCCFKEGDQKDMKESLEKIEKDGLLPKMIKDLDVNLKTISSNSNTAVYSYTTIKNSQNFGHRINFIKNSNGVWLIESL